MWNKCSFEKKKIFAVMKCWFTNIKVGGVYNKIPFCTFQNTFS